MTATKLDEAAATCIASLLRGASFELGSRRPNAAQDLVGRLAPGTDLFIEFLPSETYHTSIAAAAAARRAGFNPVPHIAARHLDTARQLDDFLKGLTDEAAVDRVLVIAGDSEAPRGPYESSLDLLRTGALERHGIRSVGIAGYPEAAPRIPHRLLDQALDAKIALAKAQGLELFIVSQFCFEAEPILRWILGLRARLIDRPVRVGLAGPANVTTLLKFAVRCGVGNSLRALKTRAESVMHLMGDADPEAIVRDLGVGLAQDGRLAPLSLHLFTFGGVTRTADWIDAALAALSGDGGQPVRRPA